MEPDDVMPNDGTFFGGVPLEPIEQSIERKKERAATLEARKLKDLILERLEEKIAYFSSIDAMPDDVKKDPVKFMNLHNSHELTRDALREEKEYIESLS